LDSRQKSACEEIKIVAPRRASTEGRQHAAMTIGQQTIALVPVASALPSTLALDVEKASALAGEGKAKGTRLYDFRI
jgi:hypothetical protein